MMKDPTKELRKFAASLPEAIEGTSCTQTSFKFAGKSAFLYVGEQGGRHKAMFKLADSMDQASEFAAKSPDDFQVGNTAWVTARFSADKPLSKKIWSRWLRESYDLAAGGNNKTAKSTKRKIRKKK